MKLTIDGMPLLHLINQHHMDYIANYDHSYLLVNESERIISADTSTPIINSVFINPNVLHDFAYQNTRAIPIKKSFRNREHGIIIGRGASCDIVINSSAVSRHHAKLLAEGNIAFVEDLKSTNGIIIGGQKKDVAKLESQTIMLLGGSVGAVFISCIDLQMLCSMLPEHWEKVRHETRTSIELAPLAQR